MLPGDVIAERFEIERRAGAGGMGDIYQARDQRTGGALALKVLRFGEANAEQTLKDAESRALHAAAEIADPALRRGFLERVPDNARTLELARRWLGQGERQEP